MKTLWILLAAAIPCSVFGQEYIEASGKTAAFNLTAGAKASWDQTGSAVLLGPRQISGARNSIRLSADKHSIAVVVADGLMGMCNLELYATNGRKVARIPLVAHSQTVDLKSLLGPGYYVARIVRNSAVLHATTLLVAR